MLVRGLRGLAAAGAPVLALALAAASLLGERAPAQTVAPPAPVLSFTSSSDAGFDAWRSDFAARAIAMGRRPAVVQTLLSGLAPDPRIIAQDQNQAEFVRPPWDYINGAVSAQRVQQGLSRRAEHAALFAQVQERYGVDADIIASIWAVETNYGTADLNYSAANALATLAYDQRRRARFEGFFLALIEMVERGYAGPAELKSSWAGALGQPQFMPDMYLSTAADWDGDGRRDIWTNTGDVLASIANYLAKHGWRRGDPVFEEVRLPANFDYALADNSARRLSEWQSRGVLRVSGAQWNPVEAGLTAQLHLPAGWQGPALLLFENFSVIKTYNNSDRYALAVALLARGFKGQGGLVRPWPTQLGALHRDDILTLQQSLNRIGYNAGAPDGMFGSSTRRAVRSFQQANSMPADGYPTDALLDRVRALDPEAAAAAPKPSAKAQLELERSGARALTRAQIKQLQRNLNALGYRLGPPNGLAGPRTRAAIEAEENKLGLTPSGRATTFILAQTRKRLGR